MAKWLNQEELENKTGKRFRWTVGRMYFCSECGKAVARPLRECPYCHSKTRIGLVQKDIANRHRTRREKTMNRIIRKTIRILEMYPAGTRVELVQMNDAQAPPPGTKGTVTGVDAVGTIHVRWDNGSTLGIVLDAGDRCRKI